MVKQTIADTDEPKVVTVKLFQSFHEGFGDADQITGDAGQAPPINAPQRYNRGHGSIDPRWPGQIRMGMSVKRTAVDHDLTPVFAQEWTDTNGVYPAIFYLVGQKIMKIRFGAVTEVGTDALGSNATDGMFDDNGSGIPYLYASFTGVSSGSKIRRMNRAQTVTTSADVWAHLMLSLNGKAYRTITPTSGTANCQVSVCPYGRDRFVLSNWLAGVTVGWAGTSINVLTAVRNAPVAIKPEGVFAYNATLDQWIDYTPSWWHFVHLDNGKGAFFIGDSLVIPMGDGGAVIFDGNNVRPFDPVGLSASPNVHTTKARFTTMAALRHWIAGATGIPAKYISAGNSLRMFVDNAGFTDESADVRDLDLTTEATLPAGPPTIYIGWDRPFTGFRFDTGSANLVARTMTVKVGTAPATYTAINVVDFTSLAGAPLGQSGAIVMREDPVAAKGWVKTTVNSVEKYWVQITFSGAITASTSWLTCQIQPWYPSVDYDLFPLDGLDKSGALPHILMGRGSVDGSARWHDVVSLSRPDEIGEIVFGDIGGTGINKSRGLIAIGRFNVWHILTADDDRPGTEPAPILNDVGLIEAASIVPRPGKLTRLTRLRINGHDADPALKLLFYYTWDAGKKWSKWPKELGFPSDVSIPEALSAKGYRFRWAIGWQQSSAGERLSQPVITDIEADFAVLPDKLDATQERAVQSPPRI